LVKSGFFESEDNMNRLFCIASLLLLILPVVAQAPKGIVVWKSADLKAYAATLKPKVNEQKVASQALADFGAYNALIGHREGSGEAEWHDNAADFMVIQSGECTLILGGTIKDSHTTGAGEIRGTSIEGGQSYAVAPGDIVNIPAKTPHQMILPAGGQITYFVVKVPTH
jgi:mannose-6-phosphate isomerase-like protein (cupin superfamily)